MKRSCAGLVVAAMLLGACAEGARGAGERGRGAATGGEAGGPSSWVGGSGAGGSGAGGSTILDAAPGPACSLPPEVDELTVTVCEDRAPPHSFDPVVQWTWKSPEPDVDVLFAGSFVTPLVGNFPDDNGDGAIDLCDTPDVLVSVVRTFRFDLDDGEFSISGTLHLLSGAPAIICWSFLSRSTASPPPCSVASTATGFRRSSQRTPPSTS